MKQWVGPLVATLKDVGIDASSNGAKVESALDSLNADVESIVARIPAEHRKLVTGHESMGYFAERYKFQLIGAVLPSITSQAEASAGDLAALTGKIRDAGVPAILPSRHPSSTVGAPPVTPARRWSSCRPQLAGRRYIVRSF